MSVKEEIKEVLVRNEGMGMDVNLIRLELLKKGVDVNKMRVGMIVRELWEDVVFSKNGKWYKVERRKVNGKMIYGVMKVDGIKEEDVWRMRLERNKNGFKFKL